MDASHHKMAWELLFVLLNGVFSRHEQQLDQGAVMKAPWFDLARVHNTVVGACECESDVCLNLRFWRSRYCHASSWRQ